MTYLDENGKPKIPYAQGKVKMHDLINIIIVTLDARDPYTYLHSERVAAISVLIGTRLELDKKSIEKLHISAHLHDIGKIGVPDLVLNKEGRLSKDEIIQMQSHSKIGHNILNKIHLFKEISGIVLHHHERFDGEGYPDNIKGESIPLASRIIAVADSFDAITSDRPYRLACGYEKGFDELNKHVNEQFCPNVMEAFNAVRGEVIPLLEGIGKTKVRHMAFVGHENLIHSRRVL